MRYVALGSSMAAGPGIPPRARDSDFRAGRSENNYPHLLARRLGYELVDVSYSRATTADLLRGRRAQVDALDGNESLVTITVGGNDVGYVPMLMAGAVPRLLRPRSLFDEAERMADLEALPPKLTQVAREVCTRAPKARVVFVDYLTLLPPEDSAKGLSDEHVRLGRRIAEALARITAEVAGAEGCELVRASRASRDHHPWSTIPWSNGPGLPIPGRPVPFHPNEVGMRAVAALLAERVSG